MKKILALVVAFVLCFTAVAGCFTATAEDAVPTITIKDATAADGAIVIPVEGTNLQSVDSYLITVVLPADYTDIAVEGMTKLGDNGGDYVVNGTTVKMLNEIEKIDTDNDGAIAFNVTAKVPAVEADRVDDVTATVDAGNADAQPVDVTIVPGKATLKAPVVEPEVYEDAALKLNGANLTLENGIAVNYYVKVADGVNTFNNYEDSYVVFTKDTYDAEGNKLEPQVTTVEYKDTWVDNNGYVNFTLPGICPQEIGNNISATIYGIKGDKVYTGGTVASYSVLTYARNILRNAAQSDAIKRTVADLVIYGQTVQTTYPYNTPNLAGDVLTEMLAGYDVNWRDYVTTETPELNKVTASAPLDGASVKIKSASLTLEDIIVVNFLVTDLNNAILGDYSDYYVKVDYVSDGGAASYELDVDPATGNASLTSLISIDMKVPVTAVLMQRSTGAAASNTVTYSIESYAYAKQNDATVGALVVAMMKYGNSVRAYAGLD